MEFKIVVPAGSQAAVHPDNKTYLPEEALRVLRASPALMAEDIKTGERYGRADLEKLLEQLTRRGGDA